MEFYTKCRMCGLLFDDLISGVCMSCRIKKGTDSSDGANVVVTGKYPTRPNPPPSPPPLKNVSVVYVDRAPGEGGGKQSVVIDGMVNKNGDSFKVGSVSFVDRGTAREMEIVESSEIPEGEIHVVDSGSPRRHPTDDIIDLSSVLPRSSWRHDDDRDRVNYSKIRMEWSCRICGKKNCEHLNQNMKSLPVMPDSCDPNAHAVNGYCVYECKWGVAIHGSVPVADLPGIAQEYDMGKDSIASMELAHATGATFVFCKTLADERAWMMAIAFNITEKNK